MPDKKALGFKITFGAYGNQSFDHLYDGKISARTVSTSREGFVHDSGNTHYDWLAVIGVESSEGSAEQIGWIATSLLHRK